MSFSPASDVSPTTGWCQPMSVLTTSSKYCSTASRTDPTLLVLVIDTGPPRTPPSSTHAVPVRSPNPFPANQPAKTGAHFFPSGHTTVTPVRAACSPVPSMIVVSPTSTPD